MNVIISYKPIRYMHPLASYAGIARVNIDTGEVVNVLRIPSANFRTNKSFMVSNAQGLAIHNGLAYVGMWNYVAIVDLDTFTIIDGLSSPEFSDIHSLEVVEDQLLVISTASEVLSSFDLKTLKRNWYWGAANSPILAGNSIKFLPPVRYRLQGKVYSLINGRKYARIPKTMYESRHVHKTCSPYYRHHMNNVVHRNGDLYVNTKGWFDTTSSAVIKLNLRTFQEEFFAAPGTFMGSHDGNFDDGKYYVTEADNNSVAWIDTAGEVNRVNLLPNNYFVRGLEKVGDKWVVGFTPRRNTDNECLLIVYDEKFKIPEKEIPIDGIMPKEAGVAVHAIKYEK